MTEHWDEGGWLQTAWGGRFYPANPRSGDISIQDIAAALSKLCRYGGHCKEFYSVAEHCVLMSQNIAPEHRLAALLHDASEAYLVDLPRPVKKLLPEYSYLEDTIMKVIAEKFGFDWPLPKVVKELDTAMLFTEREQNMRGVAGEWENEQPGLPIRLKFWDPLMAENQFLKEYLQITRQHAKA